MAQMLSLSAAQRMVLSPAAMVPTLDSGSAGDGNSADDFLAYMQLEVERRRTAGHPRTAEKFFGIHNKL
jgi:hypothetical protein